jgi:hypothetical protein
MRSFKIFGIFLVVLAFVSLAAAGEKNLGIKNSYRVKFDSPVRLGATLLPAGDYSIRHSMEGEDHIMVFHAIRGKAADVSVKCQLVPLSQKAQLTTSAYTTNAANERVLREMTFRGDTAKHVF